MHHELGDDVNEGGGRPSAVRLIAHSAHRATEQGGGGVPARVLSWTGLVCWGVSLSWWTFGPVGATWAAVERWGQLGVWALWGGAAWVLLGRHGSLRRALGGAASAGGAACGEPPQSEERFRQVLYQAADAMLLVDTAGVIVEANDKAAQLYECEQATLSGRPLGELDVELTQALLGPWSERVAADGASLGTHEVIRSDGRKIPLEIQVGCVEHGAARYFLCTARDLSERKRLEAQLMLADRMVSVGTLAAGVAHEINNPLTALMLNLELIERQLHEVESELSPVVSSRLLRGVRRVREGGERVGVIVRDLRTFSRDEGEARTEVDLREVIESTLGLAQPELRRYATVSVEYEGCCVVLANHSRLGQVVLNLALNAAHAFGDRPLSQNQIVVRVRDEREQVALEVEDNGPGMAPDVLARVFDPFFTTKPAGIGTGLGLFICRNIVEAFGGRIEVSSGPGRGATFRVLLPAAARRGRAAVSQRQVLQGSWPPPASSGPKPMPVQPQPRAVRVLIIDDEPSVARTLEHVLHGHEVEVAADAQQARAKLSQGEPYDLVLCDFELHARSDGSVHAQATTGRRPAARRWVFMTGASSAHHDVLAPANDVLEKPVRGEALWALLDEGAA